MKVHLGTSSCDFLTWRIFFSTSSSRSLFGFSARRTRASDRSVARSARTNLKRAANSTFGKDSCRPKTSKTIRSHSCKGISGSILRRACLKTSSITSNSQRGRVKDSKQKLNLTCRRSRADVSLRWSGRYLSTVQIISERYSSCN